MDSECDGNDRIVFTYLVVQLTTIPRVQYVNAVSLYELLDDYNEHY